MAFSDGSMITGPVSASCIDSEKGKKVTFGYRYDSASDHLIITVRGEEFYYKRKNG